MRRLLRVGLVFLCLGLAGCSLSGKKNSSADTSPRTSSGGGGGPRNDFSVTEASGPLPGANGLLAGQVMDSFNRRTGSVMIQVVDLQDPKGGAAARIEVEADKNGYFTIQGLQPGKHYQLIARIKDGERLLSGSALATPPNPRLSIVVSEEYTSPSTPALPLPKAPLDKGKGPKPTGPAATIQPPRAEDDNPARPPADTHSGIKDPSKIVGDGTGERWPKSPPVDIKYVPPPKPITSPRNPEEDPLLPGMRSGAERGTPDIVPTKLIPVNSCVLVGKTLDNFSLPDLDGQPWEYKRDRRGRLTLLHFWHSSCPPCLHTVPVLVKWQKDLGPVGLEVIGISYETGEQEKQVECVRSIRGRYSINYLTLLGGQRSPCQVETQFRVSRHPTLVLLDEKGQIVRSIEGFNQTKFAELEFEMHKLLERR